MATLIVKLSIEIQIEVPDKKVTTFIKQDLEDMIANSVEISNSNCPPDWDEKEECEITDVNDTSLESEVIGVIKQNGKPYIWNGKKLIAQKIDVGKA